MGSIIKLSIVVPVFNEENNLEALIRELNSVLEKLDLADEIICVNDGSSDGSLAVLNCLANRYSRLHVISHANNLGESAAEATGFLSAQGEVIITIDADLQHDPKDIPELLKRIDGGDDCVIGVRQVRRDNFIRKLSSGIANWARNLITGDFLTDSGCTFRAIRRSALKELFVFNGMHRFLPTILKAQGYSVVEINVNHRNRYAGKSKYSIKNRLWRGFVDCIGIRWYRSRVIHRR